MLFAVVRCVTSHHKLLQSKMASQIVSPADSILGIGGSVHADGTVLISGNPEISLESQTPSGPKKSTGGENTKQRVCYFYDGEIGNF